MKPFLVGGPLLGNRQQTHSGDIASWKQFEPLITPEISLGKQPTQRFILLPRERFVSVLAYNTGVSLASLVPDVERKDEKENNLRIESVCLARHPRKASKATIQDVLDMDVDQDESSDTEMPERNQVGDEIIVMVGCSDGTIREFSLDALGALDGSKIVTCGSFQILGPFCRPRRVIKVSKREPISQISVPNLTNQDDGILAYVVIRTKDFDQSSLNDKTSSSVNVAVLRILIPHFDGSTSISLSKSKDGLKRKQRVDSMKCRIGIDKHQTFLNTSPFRLLTVSRTKKNNQGSVYLVLARANSVIVYYEQMGSSQRFPPISFPMPTTNPLSALSVSNMSQDITCGHFNGDIKILKDIFDIIEHYHISMVEAERQYGSSGAAMSSASKPTDPRKTMIISEAHWHAHPVTSLVHDAGSSSRGSILYSGGEESVLVTWQASRGTDRPTDVLPRLALGGIVHIACADKIDESPSSGILVYCEDNSLQLFESHNKSRKWKLQSLACCSRKEYHASTYTSIQLDPRANISSGSPLVTVGLSGAPGHMDWYDPLKEQVLCSLEVAPFNRVSRTEADDSPLPTPSITNHAFSKNGSELITLDESPTENLSVGAYERIGENDAHGIVSTIRFWAWNESQDDKLKAPYSLLAAMTYPHGPKNRVSGLAISNDGNMACTVSNDEKAFRVWNKSVADKDDDTSKGRAPIWTCRYKLSIPAGFSKYSTSQNAIAFSDDGSILAIAFGSMVTLWDSDEARFLTSLRHLEDFKSNIDSILFVKAGKVHDLLLIKSSSGVSLQSPFGMNSSFRGWGWGLPEASQGLIVTDAELMKRHDCVAISVFDSKISQSRILLINSMSGLPGFQDDHSGHTAVITGIEGCIQSICSEASKDKQSNWGSDEKADTKFLNLFALMTSGELLQFTNNDGAGGRSELGWNIESQNSGPRLDVKRKGNSKRQRVEAQQVSISSSDNTTKKTAYDIFGISVSADGNVAPPPTAELPILSTAFVRAFVGRGLTRKSPGE